MRKLPMLEDRFSKIKIEADDFVLGPASRRTTTPAAMPGSVIEFRRVSFHNARRETDSVQTISAMKTGKNELSPRQCDELLTALKARFEKNPGRHPDLSWPKVRARLEACPDKLWSLAAMERTGGEPDVVGAKSGEFIFMDCAAESPSGRRSVCYDREGWLSRKEARPKTTAMDMATEMGIALLTEEEYCALQQLGEFDTKTSSWIATPAEIRERGGALYAELRYGRLFIGHNGAQSYYAARGFRGVLRV